MTTMKIKHILPALAAAFVLTACNNDKDGDWDPMNWEKNSYSTTKVDGKKYIQVPQQGGTYTFSCKNYEGFWLSSVDIITSGYGFTMEKHLADGSFGANWNHHHMQSDGCSIDIEENSMTVHFDYSDAHRVYTINVTAGDIFDSFRFIQ